MCLSIRQLEEKQWFSLKSSIQESGIAPENIHKILESFTQESSETTRKFGGTGLGLAISKNWRNSAWYDWNQKVAGKGTTFIVKIPYPAAEIPKAAQVNHIPSEDLQNIAGISILLVEDNDFNRIVAVDTLQEELPDIKIDIAVNGLEAVEKVKSRTYDVVLMDVQMPEMNGYDATRTIRTLQEPACNTRIIAMTASALKRWSGKMLPGRYEWFYRKPFWYGRSPEKKIRRMIHGEIIKRGPDWGLFFLSGWINFSPVTSCTFSIFQHLLNEIFRILNFSHPWSCHHPLQEQVLAEWIPYTEQHSRGMYRWFTSVHKAWSTFTP